MERQRGYQRHPRRLKRLEAVFTSGDLTYRGILSDISSNGIFIRTNRGFTPGTIVSIQLILPNNQLSSLKGIVRRSTKTPLAAQKNGMGIELLEKDETFIDFVASVFEARE